MSCIKTTAYSERIYKNKVKCEPLQDMLKYMNDIKIKVYSDKMKNKISELNTTYLRENYDVNTYYANMVIREVNQIENSNKELQKIYIDDYETKIKDLEEKIKTNTEKLDYWRKIKTNIINKTNKKEYKTYIKPFSFKENGVVAPKNVYTLYEFEVYTDNRINCLKNKLYQFKNKLNRLKQEKANIEKRPYISCFGSKKLFKSQFTKEIDHKEWYDKWYLKRHSIWTISGSKNHECGSMCARYIGDKLHIMKHTRGVVKEGHKQETQSWFEVPVKFVYNKELLYEKLANKETVAYQIKDYGDYYIIMAVFDIYYDNIKINNYTLDGVNAIDINVDRFALSTTDKYGNLINRKVIYLDLDGKTSKETDKILETAILEVLEYCKENHKPLVREDIKKIKFKDTKNKKTNKKLSQFAYDKMINKIDRCFLKNDIEVYKVNPKYTSQMGKIKYMAQKGMSIHESAAYCIGRRFMFSEYKNGKVKKLYYENMGKLNKFSIATITKEFKKLRINDIYKIKNIKIDVDKYENLKSYVKDIKEIVK